MSPVLPLIDQILYAFQHPNDGENTPLLNALLAQEISPEFLLEGDADRPFTPSVVVRAGETPFVRVSVTYLEVLWCVAYGWGVLYEEGYQKPAVAGNYEGAIFVDTELKRTATALLDWAASLRNGHSEWPGDLPKPRHPQSDDQALYVAAADRIMIEAAACAMLHELGHVHLRHRSCLLPRAGLDRATAIQCEKEADAFALGQFVSANDDEDRRQRYGWSVLTPMFAALYMIETPANLFAETHPYLHHRIADCLSRLNYADARNVDYFKFLCTLILDKFAEAPRQGHAQGQLREFYSASEAFDATLDELDQIIEAVRATREDR